MIIENQGQQGDVYVSRVDALPSVCTEVAREDGGVVLAHGEVTGHKHQFRDEHVKMFASNDNGVERRFIVISEKPATLVHEEHSPHTYAPGIYEIKIAREWTDENEPRRVLD